VVVGPDLILSDNPDHVLCFFGMVKGPISGGSVWLLRKRDGGIG
jgi:hypothetical protein